MQNTDHEGPYYVIVCVLQKCKAVDGTESRAEQNHNKEIALYDN